MDAILSVTRSAYSWSGMSLAALGLATIGIAIWWVIRKRLREFLMPIVRVLDLPVSRLPRIVIKAPPLIPFLAFLAAATALIIWTTKPSLKVFSDFEPGMSQIHVYVDMSPSVSSQISLNDLGAKLVSVLDQIGPKARVTFGTSHGDDVYELTTPAAATDLIVGLGFHRGGSKIGAGVRTQVARIGDIDQVFVISDRDQHSWGGFQWQYLLVDADIRHVDVDDTGSHGIKSNIFIQDARYLSPSGSLTMDWDVEIAEGVLATPASGTLNASVGGESLATANWEIPAGRRSTTVSLSWPSTKIPEDLSLEAIEWTVEVAGGDAMVMDNRFRTPVVGHRDRVVVVGEPAGELRLEDFLMPLETALSVSGHEVSRFDRWPSQISNQMTEQLRTARFWVASTGDTNTLDYWCPAIPKSEGRRAIVPIWLTPRIVGESFTAMCQCVARYGVGVSKDMCDATISREQWIATLAGVGAKQIGGDAGMNNDAVGMKLVDRDQGVDLTLFTVPLRPDAKLGLTWGEFPILVKQLAAFTLGQFSRLDDDARGALGDWPRVSDISQVAAGEPGADSSRSQILRQTNVPVGESMLAVVPTSDLPPSWSAGGMATREHMPSKRDSEDPWPWVRGLAVVILIAVMAEALWLWRHWLWRPWLRRVAKVLPLIMLPAFINANPSSAQARIDWMAPVDPSNVLFRSLAREVSSRTSLELSPKPDFFGVFDDAAAERPWIWTSTPTKLAGSDGRMSMTARLWLKRGGLLIVDGAHTDETLDKLFEPLMRGTVKPSGWMAMPPDHEFMRSFYLLNSLPTCKGKAWRIFSFDGRVTAIAAPYSLLDSLRDQPARWSCESQVAYEQQVRIFVNLMMTAFTTDYKRDQIHLPEILKRLRVPQ
jgi:hypothetical protein